MERRWSRVFVKEVGMEGGDFLQATAAAMSQLRQACKPSDGQWRSSLRVEGKSSRTNDG